MRCRFTPRNSSIHTAQFRFIHRYNLSDFVTYNTTSEELSPPLYANVTVHDGEYCLHVNDSKTYVAILGSEMALRTYELPPARSYLPAHRLPL